jgi:hypothetical protein
MRHLAWRELPYGLVGAALLLAGSWLSRHYPDSSVYLWVMALGLAVLLGRAAVRIYTGVTTWRHSEAYRNRRRAAP